MGQTLQHFTSRPRVCKKEEDMLRYAWDALQSKAVDDIIINEVTLSVRGMYGDRDVPGITVHKEYTPLVIACMHRDLKLAKQLIKEGADVNLCPQENKFASEDGVPPLYYATAARDAEIVRLLLNSGANVNGNKGKSQCINLQKPMEELYSIFEIHCRTAPRCVAGERPSASFPALVELYLAAGAKLNSTRWGPCLFNGRGRVFEANQPTTLNIPGPYFKCDAAILLLQHGVDPNLYRLKDVWFQFSGHGRFNMRDGCVSFDAMLKTFLGAGYHITTEDRDNGFFKERLGYYDINVDEPLSLKQLCRSHIRTQLRIVLNDTTIFPSIDELSLPTSLKQFLKLYDIIDLNKASINCRGHY
uniref:Ankyrin repeat and SOCS box protein 2-like isoform X1 n=1 Tax=Crassostrea virginica TaxID=6565 RepID=A0A8B8BEK8_CRAVI|nr:ankyrin repeat and SOCS box protein 2-like isoform X1 [Crassostrea virginica]XP_022301212.1 ankyrin repeat and SOCS box protein 2-like isoform X1 [Crassostrea virginica]XP_022301213.1 ankyrin repeat and SOCS box protein 2-like isoform X1 [Crassostrea virginica]XP_022301214.1 ankyrin repeat and SOCS box protein 2-like isoform X1 [Crassostrea virginica]XP_022301215.1 ankyrin repeat and SOCS box protein 2-like isoform X1 [Crassostrea virginica]